MKENIMENLCLQPKFISILWFLFLKVLVRAVYVTKSI